MTQQEYVLIAACVITFLPWALFIIAKLTMKDEPDED